MKKRKVGTKHPIGVTIDKEVYIQLCNIDINVSSLVNEFLKNFLNTKFEDKDTTVLQRQLEDAQQKKDAISKSISELSAELAIMRAKKQKASADKVDKLCALADGLQASGMASELGDED